MFLYKVVSVLISDSVLSLPQSFGQSFASASFTDPSGRLITKTAYSETGLPDLEIGLVPPFSGEYNDIESQVLKGFPEPIIIIKPPPFTKKPTKSYTTAFTTTKTTSKTTRAPITTTTTTATTKAPATVRATTAFIPRTTQAPRVFTRPPTQVNNSRQGNSSGFTGTYRTSGEDGRYRAVGNDGTYRPKKNEGAYVHNNAGAYKHINSGAYKPDNRGQYRGN
jgi:hypothetical protein